VAVLSKNEMVEVLDIMFDLNKRREQLTINRMRLTEWVFGLVKVVILSFLRVIKSGTWINFDG
jgi:hypothetical protein